MRASAGLSLKRLSAPEFDRRAALNRNVGNHKSPSARLNDKRLVGQRVTGRHHEATTLHQFPTASNDWRL